MFLATENVKDDDALSVVSGVCATLNISLAEAADAFGEYWMNVYAPRIYYAHYQGKESAREFLLAMDTVHQAVTNNIPDAQPPRFDYEWKKDATLIMKYKSGRGLIDFVVGLVKGVGKYYDEDLAVKKKGDAAVEIVFSS